MLSSLFFLIVNVILPLLQSSAVLYSDHDALYPWTVNESKTHSLLWKKKESHHFKTATFISAFPLSEAKSEKSLLQELWQATSKQQEDVLNSVFLCLKFLFKPSQVLCGLSCAREYQSVVVSCLFFLATRLAYTWNTHIETLFIKSLLGPLALVSY